MPKIPRAQELGLQSGPAQQTRGVVDVPVPDTSGEKAAGRAMVEVGSKLYEFGAKIQQAQVDRQVVAASRKTREDLDRAYRDLEQAGDLDPTQFEKLYRETSDKIISENAKAVPGGGRAMWEERARNWQSDGVIQSRNLTRTRQLEAARANLINENAAVGKQVGDLSLSEATVEASILGQRGLIDRQVREGFLGKDDGARLIAELDTYLQKDKLFRARDSVERLTMAGDDVGAETMIAEFKGTAEEQKALSQAREAAQQDMRAETSRQEAERRKAEIKASNEFEMGVLTEGYGYKQLQSAVDRGEISINDQPALYRSIRAEQDRKKAEAAAAKLTEAEKNEWKAWSQKTSFELESSATMTAAEFMRDPTQWEPDLYERYQNLTPEDQRALNKKRLAMRETGRTTPEIDRIENRLLDEAKRIAPSDWKIGSTGQNKSTQARELAGFLREAATGMAPETGGRDLTPEQLRSAAALAIGRVTGGENLPVVQWEKWSADADVPTLGNIYSNSVDRRRRDGVSDPALYDSVFAKLTKKYGGPPTMEQMQAGYKQAVDALEGLQ